MENTGSDQPDLLPTNQVELNEESSNHLKDAGIWAKTIAIILCVICGLAIVAIGFFGTIFSGLAFAYSSGGYMAGVLFGIVIMAGLAALFIVNLFRFSSGMSAGITHQDETEFEKGITGLRNYFILSGVFVIISSLYYLLQLIN